MKAWYCLSIFAIFIFSLAGCSTKKSPMEIASQLEESVVLINYKNQEGHGTGFFVPGKKNSCTVLTARHVASTSETLQLTTNDYKVWKVHKIQPFTNQDLALLTFSVESNQCPYQNLRLGDSDTVKRGQTLYVSGFYDNGGQLVNHFVSCDVTAIDSLPDGYSISYQATTTKGMSGSPVINSLGKVVAVHGRTDIEITRLAIIKNSPTSQLQSLNGKEINSEEILERGAKIDTFKWGIPINLYLANIPQEKFEAIPTLSAEDFYNQGNDLLASKKYERAIIGFDKAIKIKSNYADAWFGRGFALSELGKYQEALESYNKTLEFKPDRDEAWFGKGDALYELGRYEEVVKSYDKALEFKPDREDTWYKRGNALYELSRYEEAIRSYEKALEFNSNRDEVWFAMGIALDELGRYEDALESYDKVLEFNSDRDEVWLVKGIAFDELGKFKEALESYDRALEFKPNDAGAWFNRGITLGNLNRYEDALESYDKALEFKPNDADAWFGRGFALENLGRYQEALNSYNKAIEINSN